MSLFGTSPDESTPAQAPKSRLSLFDDEPSPAAGAKSSLFADDDSAPGASPWGMPTPKKAAQGGLVKNLLSAAEVPDSYIDTFDELLNDGNGSGGKLTAAGISKVLSGSKLGADQQSRIVSIITSGGPISDITRNEFNVLLALIGLAQEHEDITLDGVDERRKSQSYRDKSSMIICSPSADLPEPKLPSFNTPMSGAQELAAKPPQRPASPPPAPQSVSPPKPRTMRKDSIDFPEADPWGSPAMHKGHNHEESSQANGAGRGHAPVRTTSNFTTTSTRTTSHYTTTSGAGSNGISNQQTEEPVSAPAAAVWGSYDGNTSDSYRASNASTLGGEGFEPTGGAVGRDSSAPTRSFGGGRASGAGVEENVIITLLPEKEGMFLFQHHNYQVESARRGSKVVRRYSDFVWLLDCLQKRFPFRQLPLLPPKRVAGKLFLSIIASRDTK